MSEDAPQKEIPVLNRRDFLKAVTLGTVAGTGLALASKVRPITEALTKLSFTPDVLLETKPLSDADSEIVRGELAELGDLIGFEDTDTWNKSIEQFLSAHKNISTICQGLDNGSEERALASADLYELSTVAWVFLKIKNDFKENGEELRTLIDSKQITEHVFTNYGLEITTKWIQDSITALYNPSFIENQRETLMGYLFTDPGALGSYADNFFDWFLADEQRNDEIERFGKADGATLTEISGDITEIDRVRVLRQLENLRLSKVAGTILFYKTDDPRGEWLSGGRVTVGLSEQELNSLFSGTKEWQYIQLHEIGHCVWSLIPLIPDPKERSIIRGQLHRFLESFSPTKDLDAYLNPQGEFKSISNGEFFLERNILNEATITQYPSGHFLYSLGVQGNELLRTLLTNSTLAFVRGDDSETIEYQTLTSLEQALVTRGKQILTEIERSERRAEVRGFPGIDETPDSKTAVNMVGKPLAILDMAQNNRAELVDLTLQSSPRYTKEYIEKIIDGYLLTTQRSLELLPGDELFCQLFSSSLRMHNQNVENQMQDDRLEQFRRFVNRILDSLIRNRLARQEDTKAVV